MGFSKAWSDKSKKPKRIGDFKTDKKKININDELNKLKPARQADKGGND